MEKIVTLEEALKKELQNLKKRMPHFGKNWNIIKIES